MPNTKKISTSYDAGYSLECIIIDDDSGYIMDHADGEFRGAPATPRVPLAEHTVANGYANNIYGYYIRAEDRAVWPDGGKTIVVYDVGGVNPVKSGSIGRIYSDTFAESAAAAAAAISSGAGILFASATELITEALYELGIFAPGDAIPAENIQSGLKRLNMLLDSWSIERQLIFSRTIDALTLTAGKASYTIGNGGDFDTVRPTRIEQAYITIDSIDYPLDCYMMEDEYTGIPDKTTETRPARLYYKGTYPLGTIYFDCEPGQAYALKVYSAKPFTKFATSEDSIQYPDGYETAIMYNLAVLLAPSYGKRPSDVTLAMAQQTRQNIKRQNHEPIRQNYSGLPGSGGDEYDIITRSFAS